MLGDVTIAAPTNSTTLAVTIDAPADFIWPWLVQMGYRRGGLYSYDWLVLGGNANGFEWTWQHSRHRCR